MTAKQGIESLVIGANGLVGKQIGKILTSRNIGWQGTFNKRPEANLIKLDVTNPSAVKELFLRFLPKVVFNCANLAGGVNFCQTNRRAAFEFHLNATKDIAARCRDVNAKMVFISTDYVFDGTKGPYREQDAPNPLNFYGELKLQAEQWIKENLTNYLIIRTTNVYGWDPQTVTPNYIMGLLRTLKSNRPFNAPSFLWGNPTYVGDLAHALFELYLKKAAGIFHVVGSSFINRFEWAKRACEMLALNCRLIKETGQPSPDMVARPLKSWLNTDKFTNSFETVLHNAADGLKLMKSEMDKFNIS